MLVKCKKVSFKAGSAVISREEFDALVSLYLDSQIDERQLRLLAQILAFDKDAERLFKQAMAMHCAMCKMYGNATPTFIKLPSDFSRLRVRGRNLRTHSPMRKRAAVEWSLVAVFMLLTVVFFKVSHKAVEGEEFSDFVAASEIPDLEDSFELQLNHNFVLVPEKETSACSIISCRKKRK